MKIFDFVKNAGEKIFKPGEARRESAIEKHLEKYGIRGISVEVDGDKAVLSGAVTDTATREKAVLIAGNVEGIGNVEDRLTVTNPTPAPAATTAAPVGATASSTPAAGGDGQWISRTYTVKSGDTLSKISQEMYGEASKYQQIFEANKPMLSDPDKIYPGQVLRVPPER